METNEIHMVEGWRWPIRNIIVHLLHSLDMVVQKEMLSRRQKLLLYRKENKKKVSRLIDVHNEKNTTKTELNSFNHQVKRDNSSNTYWKQVFFSKRLNKRLLAGIKRYNLQSDELKKLFFRKFDCTREQKNFHGHCWYRSKFKSRY